MLAVEADDWWLETCQKLEAAGENVTWAVFRREFLRKYFPEDVRGKKEIEFLELKQGNLSVVSMLPSLLSWPSFIRITLRKMLSFQSVLSLRMGYSRRLRKQLDIRKSVSLLIWLIAAGFLRKTIMLITRLSVRRGVSTRRIVVNLMMPQLVRVIRGFLMVRGLVGEMLLLV